MGASRWISSEELARSLRGGAGAGPGDGRRGAGGGYAGLARALRALVLDGRLPLRVRLPSERDLAAALGVSRTTTTAAYDVLRAEGYLESRRGSGTRVALPTGGAVERELPGVPASPGSTVDGGAIDLTVAALPAPGRLMEAVERATADLAGHLGSSGYDPSGILSLRTAIAEHYERRGLPTEPDEIVVTSGAQHALSLLLDVLADAGDALLIEVPTYPNALEAARRAGVRMVRAPVRATGWDVEMLDALLRRNTPAAAYTICDFHNPTGFLMPDEQRAAFAAAAARAGTPLIVDETFVDLDLEPWRPRPRPLAEHGARGAVVTLGSMSKSFWGGLRVGWVRSSVPLARRVARARAGVDLATAVLEQLVAQHLLAGIDEVVGERRDLLRQRRDALVAALRRGIPEWRFTPPRGGLCLWVELEAEEADAVVSAASDEGVRIVGGSSFSPDASLDRWIRLPFTQPPDVLEEAVVRLAGARDRVRRDAGAAPSEGRRGRSAAMVGPGSTVG